MPPGTAGQENEPNVCVAHSDCSKVQKPRDGEGRGGAKHFAMIRQVFPFLSLVLYAIFFVFPFGSSRFGVTMTLTRCD